MRFSTVAAVVPQKVLVVRFRPHRGLPFEFFRHESINTLRRRTTIYKRRGSVVIWFNTFSISSCKPFVGWCSRKHLLPPARHYPVVTDEPTQHPQTQQYTGSTGVTRYAAEIMLTPVFTVPVGQPV